MCEREREREGEKVRRPGGRVRACGRGGRRAIAMSAPVLFCPAHLENEPLLLERFRFCFRSLGTPWRRSGASVGEGCGPSRDASWHLDSPPPPPSTSYTRTRIPSPPPRTWVAWILDDELGSIALHDFRGGGKQKKRPPVVGVSRAFFCSSDACRKGVCGGGV